jgi:16S rRNA processing protein RimM
VEDLALGRLGAPHGVDGRIKMVSYSGETEHLLALTEATLRSKDQSRLMHIESVHENGSSVLVKFAGYDSPEAVRALSGLEVWASRDKAASLEEEEYYYADLVGCDLAADGGTVATVVGVCDAGGGDLLEARKPDGSVFYVPFRKEFVGAVDIASRRVELLAPWLLD